MLEDDINLIIEKYSNYVYKIIDNIIKNALSYQDKEEAVSDTFYLFWKNQNNINNNLKYLKYKVAILNCNVLFLVIINYMIMNR